jgi:hypothetical protein
MCDADLMATSPNDPGVEEYRCTNCDRMCEDYDTHCRGCGIQLPGAW